jgi:hypothetical protein
MNFSPIPLAVIARRPFNLRRGIKRKLEHDGGFGTQPDICDPCRVVVSQTLILFFENLFATPNELFRLRRSLPAEELQRLGLQLVGGHEEFFELFLDLGRQVRNALQLPLAVRIRRDRDDAIVADLVMLGFLYRLQHANELAAQHQARRGRAS